MKIEFFIIERRIKLGWLQIVKGGGSSVNGAKMRKEKTPGKTHSSADTTIPANRISDHPNFKKLAESIKQ